jgi:TonB-linked SusC/RagA family outer membrane protein
VSLDEVVITGTAGAEQRRSVGNSVATINAADQLAKSASITLTSLLAARAPGVNVLSTTGRVGAGPSIQIRGRNSLSQGNSPLIYVDGVRVNNSTGTGPSVVTGAFSGQGAQIGGRLNDINPDDIESIEVISGPAASTIYGTDAANGVIQIKTKRGHVGAPEITTRMETGSLYFKDAVDRVATNYVKDATGNIIPWNGIQQEIDRGTPIYRTGLTRQYNTSVAGGRDETRYYVSGGYQNTYGVEPNNSSRMFTLHANISTLVGARTDVSTSLQYIVKSDHLGADIGASPLLGAQVGHASLFPTARGFFPGFPPEIPQKLYENGEGVNHFIASGTVSNRTTNWLTQRAIVGLDYTGTDDRGIERFAPADLAALLPAARAGGSIFQTLQHRSVITADYSATAKVDLTSSIVTSTSVGGQYNNTESNSSSLGGSGFPASGVETVNSATTPSASSQSQVINTTIGGYVQQQLAWRDRLFVTGAVRVDNNSAFGEDFKWVTYPKMSASWVVSEEPFWRWTDKINTLRLRAAYGQNGRSPSTFSALRTFSPVAGASAVTPGSLGNPDLKPERATGVEFGLEAGLFNRLTIDLTRFSQSTKDAILNQSVAPSSGFSGSRPVNLGRMENKGFELQATLQAVSRSNFNWEISANFGTTKDEVKDLGTGGVTTLITAAGGANVVGYPIGGIWSRRYASADRDPTTKQAINALCDGGEGKPAVACASAPFQFLGTPSPTSFGAIANTFSFGRRVRLYASADFKRGNLLYSVVEVLRCTSGAGGPPLCEINHYPERFDILRVAAATATSRTQSVQDQYYQSGNFLKLREVSLQYIVPEKWLRVVKGATLSIAAKELHTWGASYRGLDPEALVGGSDQGVTPPLNSLIATLNLKW